MTGSFPRERSFSRENSLVVASLVVARSLVARSPVVRRLVLLCVAALFAVVALFAAATLQPAIAQNDHEVTISAEKITELSIENDVGPVTVSELNSEFTDVPDENKSQTETFEIRTNVSSDQEVVAEAIESESQGQIGELGLQVSLRGDLESAIGGYQTLLLPDADPGAKKVAGGIGQTKSSGTLVYRATATPKFNPSDDATVYIEYTIQEE
ncbi:hypothetical protein [Salinibacter ruber]|uniref:hypothetical protein n=1 Tax=Salinibacter ruber TaxID=146919 RepID=UPI002072F66C|nr:hypothetical protein [Salinibacter ruber]